MKILDGWRTRRQRESPLRAALWDGVLTLVLTVLFLPVGAMIFMALIALLMLLANFSDNSVGEAETVSVGEVITDPDTAPRDALVIQFWTNDTKAEWVGEVTARFNQGDHRTPAGERIFVHAIQSDSGEFLPWLVEERMQPVAWSPGTISWVNEANVRWQELHGRPLVSGDCPEVVYTAIGIGMWRPMAEAMAWPDTPISWDDIVSLAADPQGWARYGHPEWGQFKFGHTHPGGSNTGLLALTSLVYNTLDIHEGLTPQMVFSEPVMTAFESLEANTHHYGLSTRSLFTAMAKRGPSYLHAATNSEIGVQATNFYQKEQLRFPLVFIAPAEGTFWSENPFCLLDESWVTDDERAAAGIFRDYLLSLEAQEIAMDEWLRPVRADVQLRAPIDLAHGVDPRITPQTVQPLASVSGDTVQAIHELFEQTKKPAQIYVLMDVSGSMQGDKIRAAKESTAQFILGLHRDDGIAVYTFSESIQRVQELGRVGNVGESVTSSVRSITTSGGTALHDAVCELVNIVQQQQEHDRAGGENRLYGIVLLSDGMNSRGSRNEAQMFACLPASEDTSGIKIFTIAYGGDADEGLLERLAEATNGQAYSSDPEHIEEVYEAIAFEQ